MQVDSTGHIRNAVCRIPASGKVKNKPRQRTSQLSSAGDMILHHLWEGPVCRVRVAGPVVILQITVVLNASRSVFSTIASWV